MYSYALAIRRVDGEQKPIEWPLSALRGFDQLINGTILISTIFATHLCSSNRVVLFDNSSIFILSRPIIIIIDLRRLFVLVGQTK